MTIFFPELYSYHFLVPDKTFFSVKFQFLENSIFFSWKITIENNRKMLF